MVTRHVSPAVLSSLLFLCVHWGFTSLKGTFEIKTVWNM